MPTKANKNIFEKLMGDSKLKGILFSVLIGTVIFFVCCAVISFIMYFTQTEYSFYYYAVYFLVASGAFVTARVLYRRISGRGIVIGVLGAVPYSLVISLILVIIIGLHISPKILLIPVFSLLGGILGGITAANK